MNPKTRQRLLSQIRRAGNDLARANPEIWSYTCNRLEYKGVPFRVLDAYWDGLFPDPGCPHAYCRNSTAVNCLEMLGYGRLSAPEMREVQLMMLAWFYEMVRSKEFDSFL